MVDENKLKKALKLYLVTDSDILKGRDFYKVIELLWYNLEKKMLMVKNF